MLDLRNAIVALTCALLTATPAVAAADEAAVRELEAKCQASREQKLAVVRAEKIAECKANRRNDPSFCERHFRDYGAGGVGPNGQWIPPLFNDLPECVAAFAARDALRRRR